MLFMGSEKYPQAGEYFNFINPRGGYSNAMTSGETTTFYFEILNKYKEQAIDIFSHFFVDPLIKEKYVEKEMNAVESEFSKNINSDAWKIQAMMKMIANKKHNFSKFGSGNKKV